MWLYKTACPTAGTIWGARNTTLPSHGHVGWVTTGEDGSTRTKCYNPLQYAQTLRNHKRGWHCLWNAKSSKLCVTTQWKEGGITLEMQLTPHKTASVASDLRLLHPPPHPYYNVTVHTLQESIQTQNRNKFHNAMLKGDTVFNWNLMLDKFSESHVHASTLL